MSTRFKLALALLSGLLLGTAANYLIHGHASASPAALAGAVAGVEGDEAGPQRMTVLAVDAEKLQALGKLEMELAARLPPPRVAYWTPDSEAALLQYEQQIEAGRDHIRSALSKRFGPSASEDPAFARVFRPLNGRHPYLSSHAQIALVKLMMERRASMYLSPMPGIGTAGVPGEPQAGLIEKQRDFDRKLRAAVGETEFREYQLRESMAARQIRAGAVARDEAEFRRIFSILQATEDDHSASAYLVSSRQLRQLLGEQRYAAFCASRDPAFAPLEAVAARNGISRTQLLAAYGLILDAQSQLLAAGIETAASGKPSSAGEPQQIIERRDAAVARLLGTDAAAELIHTYSNRMIATSLQAANGAS